MHARSAALARVSAQHWHSHLSQASRASVGIAGSRIRKQLTL